MTVLDKLKEIRKKASLKTALAVGLTISATSCSNQTANQLKETKKDLTELTASNKDDVKHQGLEITAKTNNFNDLKECLNQNGLTFKEPTLTGKSKLSLRQSIITDKNNKEVGYITQKIMVKDKPTVLDANVKIFADKNSQLAKDLNSKGLKSEPYEFVMRKNENMSEYMKRQQKINTTYNMLKRQSHISR